MKGSSWNRGGIFVGVCIIVAGLIILFVGVDFKEPVYVSFGADYYTYSYSAIVDIAYNIEKMAYMIKTCIAVFLIAVGVISIYHFGSRQAAMQQTVSGEASEDTTQQNQAALVAQNQPSENISPPSA